MSRPTVVGWLLLNYLEISVNLIRKEQFIGAPCIPRWSAGSVTFDTNVESEPYPGCTSGFVNLGFQITESCVNMNPEQSNSYEPLVARGWSAVFCNV